MKFNEKYTIKEYPYIYFGIFFTFLLIFTYQLGGEVISSFLPEDSYKTFLPYINLLSQIIFILIPVLIISNLNPLGRKVILRLNYNLETKDLLIVLVGLFGFQLFVAGWAVIQQAIVPDPLKENYQNLVKKSEELYLLLLGGQTFFDGIRAIFVGAVIPAISEELLFRGLLQRSLEQKLKPILAIVISALIFSILHFIPTNIISLFTIGMFLGIVAYLTKSIVLPIILHFCNNATGIIGIFIVDSRNTDTIINEQALLVPAIILFSIGLALLILSCWKLYKKKTQESKFYIFPNNE